MPDGPDIDAILQGWPFEAGTVSVRLIEASNGREVLQMRVEMGVLQLEVSGRPDGTRPDGADTYFDHLVSIVIRDGEACRLTEEQCAEVDRELFQFYQRRICWLALREYTRAIADADHNLGLMDFARRHAPDEDWPQSHDQYRPFILFHRTQAAALKALEENDAASAIEHINRGLESIREVRAKMAVDDAYADDTDDADMVERLSELRESLRERYEVGRTLEERLADAVAQEQYELAARLRDEIGRRGAD